jgi:hypothetical protein
MDPATLLGPSSPLGYPAPYWFIELFKVIGFTLHIVPMNLWFAGIILAMILRWRGKEQAIRLSDRLMNQMPIIIAMGVNFGIVPLLFIQVAYYKVFYPATILMAWFWFAIVILLTFSYYGVYIYVIGLKNNGIKMNLWRKAAGWVSSLFFILIGFIFSNAFSLMTNLAAWPDLWKSTSIAGAPLGIALNLADPSLFPRWLMMFGIAITTTAAYIIFDTGFFARKESTDYRKWAPGFAFKLYTIGLLWFALAGSWYVFGSWQSNVRDTMFSSSYITLTFLTAVFPGFVWLMVLLKSRVGQITGAWAMVIGLGQFAVVALNAVSRQIVQNTELGIYYDLGAEPVNTQWSPLILFLLLFAAAVGVIIWMLRKAVKESRQMAG